MTIMQMKEQLLGDERAILQLLAYEVVTGQPHKYLLNFAATCSASKQVAQLATCLLNDALVYSDLAVRQGAPELAAACLAHATGRSLLDCSLRFCITSLSLSFCRSLSLCGLLLL